MASSSSSFPFRSTCPWKYHVFLSFAEEDNHINNFVGSLYKCLLQNSIYTKKEVEDGGSFSAQVDLKTIEESRILVVILSKNYVSSPRCLDELEKIMECWTRNLGQVVVPIFYKVDASAVINQKDTSVAEAFVKHEEDFKKEMKKVQRWKEALTKLAAICGWDLRGWEERMLIEEIVRDISDKLVYTSSNDSYNLIGMGCHITHVERILSLESSDVVHMVGIWGMGGIGKTTIAKLVYDRLSNQFQSHCFLENVKEMFRTHGCIALQQKLIAECSLESKPNRFTFNAGFNNRIKKKLGRNQVLLVLDDVDDWKQLEILASQMNWFGPGSRIIITTRDKHLLEAHGLQSIYEVKYLNIDQALQLFSQHAFKQNNPMVEFLQLSKRFTSYAKGLPLALMVLGSFLKDRGIIEWQIVIDKLAMIPDLKIHQVLQVSFDGLDDTQREIFLDIACFLNGKNESFVREILEGCGFFPDIAFAVLKDKALITIADDDKSVTMHDLLQEMGQNIVRQESKQPGERTRLWIPEEICQVLTKNAGTKTVECISLDMTEAREMELDFNAFARMNRLRFVNFYFTGPTIAWEERLHLPHGLGSLSSGLRYLRWNRFPLKSLPSNFCAQNLVELILPDSNVQQLWTGAQHIPNLKKINLESCKYLTTIPDLSNAKNIEIIDLQGCESLIELPSSVQHLQKLEYLNLRHCGNLRSLPERIDSKFLKEFYLAHCSNVKKCPEIFGNLRKVDLSWTAVSELPQSLQKLTVLSVLNITGCWNISKFPEISRNVEFIYIGGSMEELPMSIHLLGRLVTLKINDNKKLLSLPSSIWQLKSLEILDLSGCSNFEFLPEILEHSEVLTDLYLRGTAVKELPSTIEQLGALSSLILDDCTKLVSLPSTINQLSELDSIDVSNCAGLSSLPQLPVSLKTLVANHCQSLQTLSATSECRSQSVRFANCFKLTEKADSQLAIQHMANKFCEGTKEARILFPGSEIPEWFCDRSDGSLVKTQLPSNWDYFKGVVLCIVFANEEAPSWLEFIDEGIFPAHYWIRCICYAQDDKNIIWDWRWFDVDLHLAKSDHVLVWFNPYIKSSQATSMDEENLLRKYSGREVCFELYFEGSSQILKHCNFTVRKCGVLLLYDDDAITKTHCASKQEEYQSQPKRLKYM